MSKPLEPLKPLFSFLENKLLPAIGSNVLPTLELLLDENDLAGLKQPLKHGRYQEPQPIDLPLVRMAKALLNVVHDLDHLIPNTINPALEMTEAEIEQLIQFLETYTEGKSSAALVMPGLSLLYNGPAIRAMALQTYFQRETFLSAKQLTHDLKTLQHEIKHHVDLFPELATALNYLTGTSPQPTLLQRQEQKIQEEKALSFIPQQIFSASEKIDALLQDNNAMDESLKSQFRSLNQRVKSFALCFNKQLTEKSNNFSEALQKSTDVAAQAHDLIQKLQVFRLTEKTNQQQKNVIFELLKILEPCIIQLSCSMLSIENRLGLPRKKIQHLFKPLIKDYQDCIEKANSHGYRSNFKGLLALHHLQTIQKDMAIAAKNSYPESPYIQRLQEKKEQAKKNAERKLTALNDESLQQEFKKCLEQKISDLDEKNPEHVGEPEEKQIAKDWLKDFESNFKKWKEKLNDEKAFEYPLVEEKEDRSNKPLINRAIDLIDELLSRLKKWEPLDNTAKDSVTICKNLMLLIGKKEESATHEYATHELENIFIEIYHLESELPLFLREALSLSTLTDFYEKRIKPFTSQHPPEDWIKNFSATLTQLFIAPSPTEEKAVSSDFRNTLRDHANEINLFLQEKNISSKQATFLGTLSKLIVLLIDLNETGIVSTDTLALFEQNEDQLNQNLSENQPQKIKELLQVFPKFKQWQHLFDVCREIKIDGEKSAGCQELLRLQQNLMLQFNDVIKESLHLSYGYWMSVLQKIGFSQKWAQNQFVELAKKRKETIEYYDFYLDEKHLNEEQKSFDEERENTLEQISYEKEYFAEKMNDSLKKWLLTHGKNVQVLHARILDWERDPCKSPNAWQDLCWQFRRQWTHDEKEIDPLHVQPFKSLTRPQKVILLHLLTIISSQTTATAALHELNMRQRRAHRRPEIQVSHAMVNFAAFLRTIGIVSLHSTGPVAPGTHFIWRFFIEWWQHTVKIPLQNWLIRQDALALYEELGPDPDPQGSQEGSQISMGARTPLPSLRGGSPPPNREVDVPPLSAPSPI